MARQARFKCQVRGPDAEHVADVAMVIVHLNYEVARHLSLHAQMKVASVRRTQPGVDGNRKQEDLGDRKIHGEMAEAAPKEKPRLTANQCAGGISELLRIQSRQGLHVIQTHNAVRWNWGMARSYCGIQMINSEKRQTSNRTDRPGRLDLCVS